MAPYYIYASHLLLLLAVVGRPITRPPRVETFSRSNAQPVTSGVNG